jgi:acyl-coenzyme A thioesterase PaaI-like protein
VPESFETRRFRWGWNLFPAYRGTGGRVTYIGSDFREVRVRIPLNRRTRNYVGSIFGGSLYGAVDPIYMLMLIKVLGREYVVWDKAAAIRFRRPGRSTLYAVCRLADEEILAIRGLLESQPSVDRHYRIDLTDAEGVVHAAVEKTIYIGRKQDQNEGRQQIPGAGFPGPS